MSIGIAIGMPLGAGGKAVAPSTLLTGLAGYWKLDETGGVRADSSGNGNHLTDNNTTLFAAGKVGNAAAFVAASNQSLSHADTAVLRGGDHDWTWVFGVYFNAAVNGRTPIDKHLAAAYEYIVYTSGGLFNLYANGVNRTAATFGALALNTWYYVRAQYDSTANLLGISVNNGALDTVALATGGTAGAGPCVFGAEGAANYMNGRMDDVKFWNARLLTAAESAEDYANWLAGRALL